MKNKLIDLCKDMHANAYHHKGHGTHQKHLDEMQRILEERQRQPGYRDPDKDYSWVQAILIGAGISVALGFFILLICGIHYILTML